VNVAPSPSSALPTPTEIERPPSAPTFLQPGPSETIQPREPAPRQPMPREAPSLQPPVPEEMPPATPPSPEEMPDEPAKPGDDVEDLFKDTEPGDKKAASEPAPEATEKKADDVEDLFKDTDDKKAAAKQAAANEVTQAATEAELEALFVVAPEVAPAAVQAVKTQAGEPARHVARSTPPAPEPSAERAPAQSRLAVARPAAVQPAAAQVAVAEAPNAWRVWTDNTGNYQVNARLVSVGETSVRLLKDTGKYTTVPMGRLSRIDLDFVVRHNVTAVAGLPR
jgi:hypothetical protein